MMIEGMHGDNATVFEFAGSPVAEVNVKSAMRNGCQMSGYLFALVLDPLIRWLTWQRMLRTAPQDHPGYNSFVGREVVSEDLTNKVSFKQRGRRYKLLVGAKDDRFKVLLDWAEARHMNAPTSVPESSGVVDAPRLAQHVYAGRQHRRTCIS